MHEVWFGCDVVVEGLRTWLMTGGQSAGSIRSTDDQHRLVVERGPNKGVDVQPLSTHGEWRLQSKEMRRV